MNASYQIMGTTTVDPGLFLDWLMRTYPSHPPTVFTRRYVRHVVHVAGRVRMRQTVPLAQWMQETAERTPRSGDTYVPGQSELYRVWGNPAGLGATRAGGTAGNPDAAKFIGTPESAAEAQVAHLLLYVLGPSAAIDRWSQAGLGSLILADPRYDAYVKKYGTKSRAPLLLDLAGQWAEDVGYAEGIAGWANRAGIEKMGVSDMAGATVDDRKLVVVVDAGHRSTDRSGNPAEMALTGFMASAVVDEFRRRGIEAYWYQRDLDADSDKDETIGTLDTVASGIARWSASKVRAGYFVVFLSEHYDGSKSVIHVISPDVNSLGTRIAGGAPSWDTYANNALDRKIGAAIAARYRAVGLGNLYVPPIGSNYPTGVMPEYRTGVGLGGARLAVFAYPAAQGQDTILYMTRNVVENGGTDDVAAQRTDFTERAGKAQVDGVIEALGVKLTGDDGFAKRTPIDGQIRDRVVDGRRYFVAEQARRTLARSAVPYAIPDAKSEPAGSKRDAGSRLTVEYLTAGIDAKGRPVLFCVSKAGSHFEASAFFK